MDVVVFISDDGSDSARNCARCGACVRQPTFGGEVGDVDWRGGLGGAGDGLGHDGR